MAKTKKPHPILSNITITDIAAEGKAIAKVNDIVVFVPFVVPGDVKSLAGALATLLADGGLRDQFGSAGRDRALQGFGVAKMLESHRNLYLALAQ